MRVYETPGIYQERDSSGGGIAALRTDVTGLAGIAARGPLRVAVPVESPRQFEAWFGQPIDQGYLAYSARAFFENGGRRLWVVRVAATAAASPAFLDVADATAAAAWRIEASSPGAWGNGLAVRLAERRRTLTRGRVDGADPAVVHVDITAGFERAALVECRAGATRSRAVVAAVDPVAGTLTFGQPLGSLAPGVVVQVEPITYTLDVYDSGRLVAQFEELSLVPEHPRYGPVLLGQPWQPVDARHPDEPSGRAPELDLAVDYFRVARNRGVAPPPPVLIRERRNAAQRATLALLQAAPPSGAALVRLQGGADGLSALTTADFHEALTALDAVDEVALVAVPDIQIQPRVPNPIEPPAVCAPDVCYPPVAVPPAPWIATAADMPPRFTLEQIYEVQAALVAQCERRRDRIALLDAPFAACNQLTFAASELRAWRTRFDTPFAALYAPWLLVVDPLRQRGSAARAITRAIPPSGHVAGQCAALDLRSGVHVAPANVPLTWVQGGSLAIGETLHGHLNQLGVNVLRAMPGRGLRVLGARTLSSDADWRFVNVRRLISMIGKSIDLSIQWAVFEPNDWRTRAKLTMVLQIFLRELWSRGAMVGATPDEAFWVRCDDSNNPPETRGMGRLAIDVGIAPTVPFEFIVLRIGRDANGFATSTGEPMLAAG